MSKQCTRDANKIACRFSLAAILAAVRQVPLARGAAGFLCAALSSLHYVSAPPGYSVLQLHDGKDSEAVPGCTSVA